MAFAAVGAIGLAVAGTGAYLQNKGQKAAAEANSRALLEQQEIEKQRQKQVELDAARRKREIVRQQVAARAYALSATTNAGASYGSALPGAYGGVGGRTGVNELGINQALEIGGNIAESNQSILTNYRAAAAGNATAQFGQGLFSLGGAILSNQGAFSRVGQYFSGFFSSPTDPGVAAFNSGSRVY